MQQVPRKRSALASSEKKNKKNSSSPKKRKQSEKTEKDPEEVNDSGFPTCSTSFNDSNGCVQSYSPKSRLKEKFEDNQVKSRGFLLNNVDNLDVAQLLALGENSGAQNFTADDERSESDNSDSGMSDLEEVKVSNEPVIPKEGVNITLEVPNMYHKKKRKGIDLEAHVKRQINRVKKDIQLLIHKVHLLGWIAHLKFVNNILNDPSLMKICTTIVKSKNLYPSKRADMTYLEGIIKWFYKHFELRKNINDPKCSGGLLKELLYQFEVKQAFSYRSIVFMFIILLRFLGLKVRIIMSFQVAPVKPSHSELFDSKGRDKNNDVNESQEQINGAESSKKIKSNHKSSNKNVNAQKKVNSRERKSDENKSIQGSQNCTVKKKVISKANSKIKNVTKNEIGGNDGNDSDSDDNGTNSKNINKKKVKKIKELDSMESDQSDDVKIKDLKKSKFKNKKVIKEPGKKRSKSKGNNSSNFDSSCESESDGYFTPQSLTKNNNKKNKSKRSVCKSEESQTNSKREYFDVWIEVYLEAEEKWISVDLPRQKIHCINELYSRATHPVIYVIACNNDSTLKDVTKRYVPNWHSDTRKKRVDEEWWNMTMLPYLPPKNSQDKEEDEDINRQLSDKPLPSVISEYKDHPLYALKRHLLKFEGIYPPDAPTLGFVRGEPVYARECVVTLRSREIWYKEARVVRLKEEPYKIVKARPKFDKMTGEIKKDLPLELFGIWQTEEYIPPIATDGKVPRNEYGNVDLFKPCMLPIGTVHLEIPALNRVAKKLGIDCAPATVGFDFHSGGSHPVFNGFVVCEEFKDILLDAWNKEIDESAKKSEERREKRVYGNWKRLIRGLLIREKLKIKYAFGEELDDEEMS